MRHTAPGADVKRAVIGLAMLALAAPLIAPVSPAPAPRAVPQYVLVDSAVRVQLADAWDDVGANQHERAYCLAYIVVHARNATLYHVVAAVPATVVESHPTGITARCPRAHADDFGSTMLHTHPPATCDAGEVHCRLGGDNAWECFPSPPDEFALRQTGAPFNLVQCDRHGLVPYWPR